MPTVLSFFFVFPCFLSPCDDELRTVLASPSNSRSGFCVGFFYTGTSAEMKAIAGTILYICWISFLSFSPCIISLLWVFFLLCFLCFWVNFSGPFSPEILPLVLGFLLHFIEKLAPQPVLPLHDCYSNHEQDHGQETWSTICCRFPVESASSAQT